ncbi:hypothetical protein Misp01_49500 [Microtetraspora sp. NBRC 13810]|nr:hypothetical protein Misp01_49500 [Microtetraspora sp. NBRC 13810]
MSPDMGSPFHMQDCADRSVSDGSEHRGGAAFPGEARVSARLQRRDYSADESAKIGLLKRALWEGG